MPKKRKARRPNVPLYTGPVAPSAPAEASTGQAGGASGKAANLPARLAQPPLVGQIKADYSHVISDLKRIALLGGGLIAVLVVLSFFLR